MNEIRRVSSTLDLRENGKSARWENFRRGVYRFRSNALSMVGLGMLFIVIISLLTFAIAIGGAFFSFSSFMYRLNSHEDFLIVCVVCAQRAL